MKRRPQREIDWPRARVQDTAQLASHGASSIVGFAIAAYGLYRADYFVAFAGVSAMAFGIGRLLRPNLANVPPRDARLSVHAGTLRVDGRVVDVARVTLRSTRDGTVVAVEARIGGDVHIVAKERAERRELLRALRQREPPFVFFYTPEGVSRVFAAVFVLPIAAALYARTQGWPAWWHSLCVLSAMPLFGLVRFRIEVGRDDLVLRGPGGQSFALRNLRGVSYERTRNNGPAVWLVLDTPLADRLRIAMVDGTADLAAKLIERRIHRAKRHG